LLLHFDDIDAMIILFADPFSPPLRHFDDMLAMPPAD
jgi:hypothetical protein